MKNDKHRTYRIIVFGKTNSTFLGPWFGGFYQMQQTGLKMTNNALHILITFVCLCFMGQTIPLSGKVAGSDDYYFQSFRTIQNICKKW